MQRPDLRSDRRATSTCASCEIEIAGRPVIHVGVAFCCAGCVASGPCSCSYDEVVLEARVAPLAEVRAQAPATAAPVAEPADAATISRQPVLAGR